MQPQQPVISDPDLPTTTPQTEIIGDPDLPPTEIVDDVDGGDITDPVLED